LSDQLIELVNHLQDAADWPAVERALADFGLAEVSTSEARQAVEALLMLYPGYPGPEILGQVQRAIDERGLGAFLDGQRRDHAARATVWEWLQTATWDASRAYFDVHTRELTGAAARAVLAEDSSEVAEAHLALLNLIDHLGPDTAFAIAADPSPAEEAAGDAIDAGQAELLPWILQVCPALRPASPLLAAVSAALLDPDDAGTDEAVDVVEPIRELAEAAPPVARRALAVRLRGFRQHRPEHPGIDELIALVDVPRA
jgi:hypothetical protein